MLENGAFAKWQGKGLQSPYRWFDSTTHLQPWREMQYKVAPPLPASGGGRLQREAIAPSGSWYPPTPRGLRGGRVRSTYFGKPDGIRPGGKGEQYVGLQTSGGFGFN
jgi:hypothetical protein